MNDALFHHEFCDRTFERAEKITGDQPRIMSDHARFFSWIQQKAKRVPDNKSTNLKKCVVQHGAGKYAVFPEGNGPSTTQKILREPDVQSNS